jgi:dihydroneopterin aldolase
MTAPSDWIYLSKVSLALPPIIGEREGARRLAQTLELELGMNLDLDGAAAGDLSRSVDYAAIVDQVQFIAQHGRWRLLESMAVAVARLVLAPPAPAEQRSQVQGVLVRLRSADMPRARAVPVIELGRDLAWYEPQELTSSDFLPARIETLQETPETGAYRIHLPAGARWTVPSRMTVLVIAGSVSLREDDEAMAAAPVKRDKLRVDGGCSEGMLHPGAVLGGGDREISAPEDAPACLLGVWEGTPLSKGPDEESRRSSAS